MDRSLEKWIEKWEEAMKKEEFKETPPVKNSSLDYFGNFSHNAPAATPNIKDCDSKYWRDVYKLSVDSTDPLEDDVLTEDQGIKNDPLGSEPLGKQRDVPTKDSLGVKGAELGNTANPIYPDTRGEDQRKKVTPDWADGTKLRELVDMKDSLYKLEVKLNSNPKFGAYGPDAPEIKKIQGQIDDLKEKIDQLSNSISPDFVQRELS